MEFGHKEQNPFMIWRICRKINW